VERETAVHCGGGVICSFLIPSRARPDQCKKAIESIFKASETSQVLLRVDYDDPCLESYRRLTRGGVSLFVDERVGYKGYSQMVTFLSEQTSATWVCLMNDDMTIEGDGFDEKLAAIPTTGFIVQPEGHILGNSGYPRTHGGPCPIVPNQCWRNLGAIEVPTPCDTNLDQLLRVKNGWETSWLEGITVNHQRGSEDEQAKHKL
jgi:hypothetical protein